MITRKINAVILTITFILTETIVVISGSHPKEWELQTVYNGISARELYVELPDINRPVEKIRIERIGGTFKQYKLTYREMELTSIGYYFITAYCPYECGGSWSTASGETCHRAEWSSRLSEPTTCAIDRSIHSFSDEFYLPDFDRTFIAEDTGSGVRGRHLDLFYEEYEDVLSFPTGYYEVFSVEWNEVTVIVNEADNEYLEKIPPTEYYRKEVYEE